MGDRIERQISSIVVEDTPAIAERREALARANERHRQEVAPLLVAKTQLEQLDGRRTEALAKAAELDRDRCRLADAVVGGTATIDDYLAIKHQIAVQNAWGEIFGLGRPGLENKIKRRRSPIESAARMIEDAEERLSSAVWAEKKRRWEASR